MITLKKIKKNRQNMYAKQLFQKKLCLGVFILVGNFVAIEVLDHFYEWIRKSDKTSKNIKNKYHGDIPISRRGGTIPGVCKASFICSLVKVEVDDEDWSNKAVIISEKLHTLGYWCCIWSLWYL